MVMDDNQNESSKILKLLLLIKQETIKQVQLEQETKRKRLEEELSRIDEEESSKRLKVEYKQLSLWTKTGWTELSSVNFYSQCVKSNICMLDIDFLLKDDNHFNDIM